MVILQTTNLLKILVFMIMIFYINAIDLFLLVLLLKTYFYLFWIIFMPMFERKKRNIRNCNQTKKSIDIEILQILKILYNIFLLPWFFMINQTTLKSSIQKKNPFTENLTFTLNITDIDRYYLPFRVDLLLFGSPESKWMNLQASRLKDKVNKR